MNDHDDESEKIGQLTADLQKTALGLIKHLRTNNFRIRIEGLVPPVYITIGEGRSSYSANSVMFQGPQAQAPSPAPKTTQVPAQGAEQVAVPAAAQTAAPAPPQAAVPVAPQESVLRAPLLACFSRLKKALVA
jgi:hypothetical protein